jgi:hypothetical protein
MTAILPAPTYVLARAAGIPALESPSVDSPTPGSPMAGSRHVVPLVRTRITLGLVTPGGVLYHHLVLAPTGAGARRTIDEGPPFVWPGADAGRLSHRREEIPRAKEAPWHSKTMALPGASLVGVRTYNKDCTPGAADPGGGPLQSFGSACPSLAESCNLKMCGRCD